MKTSLMVTIRYSSTLELKCIIPLLQYQFEFQEVLIRLSYQGNENEYPYPRPYSAIEH